MKDLFTTTLDAIAEVNQKVDFMLKEAAKMRKDALEPLLDALAASGEVSIIYIYGYTPGFNDGEPCEHTFNYFVNIKDLAGDGRIEEVIEEEWVNDLHSSYRMSEAQIAENVELCRQNGHVFHRPSKEIVEMIDKPLVETIEAEKGTDYFVSFVLKDGKFERTDGDYDCGY